MGELSENSAIAQRAATEIQEEEGLQHHIQETGVADILSIMPPIVQLLHEVLLTEGVHTSLALELQQQLSIWSERLDDTIDRFKFSTDSVELDRQQKQSVLLLELEATTRGVLELFDNPGKITTQMREAELCESAADPL